ncbi:MAG: 4-hydroxythreonine-4-phosphate dehydrogenase PdxA [Elusimicrobiota bacterium]|jgi:4-hydroxythreonine-4-phosphate dehydrogenase|nr:4-hydroxythreonine-4-phosphate dehydrogenase PdxA [Elusimicrobiota bacterium]
MKRIIITAGDPLGIGPEVTVKALKELRNKNVKITVIGDKASLLAAGWQGGLGALIAIKSKYSKPKRHDYGKWGGDISFKALKLAVDMMLRGDAAALVTAPISKKAWSTAGIKFTGHTEVLRRYASKDGGALMMFTDGKINCALVSEHYAIKDLSKIITKERIKNSAKIFAEMIGKKTEIAISALNPHCGDGGKIGGEEITTIIPALKELKKEGFNISGPYPIDALWQKISSGKLCNALFMYHDAAICGLKLAAKKPIVHITAGLKFLRVSPTHGTAFDIAGKNIADASSMLAAIRYATSKI